MATGTQGATGAQGPPGATGPAGECSCGTCAGYAYVATPSNGATGATGAVTVIDPATQAISRELPVENAIQVIPNPAKHQLYVARGLEGLSILDADTGDELEHFDVNVVSTAFNPRTNKLYASDDTGNAVRIYDMNTFQLIETIGTSNPGQIAVNPNTNKIYVLIDSSSYRVAGVIDGNTDALLHYIGEPFHASAFALDLVHNRMFVIVADTNSIYSYDLNNNIQITTGPLSYDYATDVMYNPNNNAVYVAFGTNSIIEAMDSNTLSQIEVITAPANVYYLAMDARRNLFYASGQSDIFVYDVNSASFEETLTLSYGKGSGRITVTECAGAGFGATGPTGPTGPGACDPGEVLVSDTDGNIFLLDAATGSVNTAISTDSPDLSQWTIAVNRANRSIYVTENASQVRVYSADSGSETGIVNIFPQDLAGIAADPCQNLWYATSADENAVYVLEGMTNQIIQTIPLESGEFQIGPPTSIFPVPCRKKLLLFYNRNVAIIDLERGALDRVLTLSETAVPFAYDTNNCVVYASSYGNAFAIDPVSGAVGSINVSNVDFSMLAFNARLNVLYSIGYESIEMTNVSNGEQLILDFVNYPQGLVYDPQTNRPILIANDSMQILDPVTLQPISTHPIAHPGYLSTVILVNGCGCSCNYCSAPDCACEPDCENMAYALKDYELKFVDQNTGSVINTIDLPYNSYSVAYSPVNPTAFATAGSGVLLIGSDSGILVYDALTGEEKDVLIPGTTFYSVVYNPASNLIFAATPSHVYSFDPMDFQLIETHLMSGAHNGVPVLVQDPSYPYVFATDGTTGTISVWPGTGSDAENVMSSSYDITQLALDTTRKILYVYSTTGNIFRGFSYGPESFNEMLVNTSISRQPDRMEFNEATNLIYISSRYPLPGVLRAVEPETGSDVFSQNFYNGVGGLSIDNTTNRIFYSYDSQLHVLDGTTRIQQNQIPSVDAYDIAFAALHCRDIGGSGFSAIRLPSIPLPDIQLAANENGERWLRAKLHGSPLPGDRLYLRRLSRSGPKKGGEHYSVRRMAHPENPPGEEGGSLPKHLKNSAYFSGGNYWRKRAACACAPQPDAGYYRTEWALSTPDETIWLMPLDDFLGLFRGQRLVSGGNRQYYLAIDFVVARPDEKRQHASYGAPSRLLRIYRKQGGHWGVSFI